MSVAGQTGCPVECLVVEQSARAEVAGHLPKWVRHLHISPPNPDMPYSRAWAFNVGAREARGEVLILHDNDLCAPACYAREVLRLLSGEFEAARLQRFIFYLGDRDSRGVIANGRIEPDFVPEAVVHNNHGGTLAVRRSVYLELGGHDEGFLGWGGEDNEMFDRLRTRRLHDHAFLPFVHLYHGPQADKGARHPNTDYFEARMRIPAARRVAELSRRPFGSPEGPDLLPRSENDQHGNRNPADAGAPAR
jgi:hypothetical protein